MAERIYEQAVELANEYELAEAQAQAMEDTITDVEGMCEIIDGLIANFERADDSLSRTVAMLAFREQRKRFEQAERRRKLRILRCRLGMDVFE